MAHRKIKPASVPFHLLCKPIGAQCNLRCEHCFYLEKTALYAGETSWTMSDETLEAFTRAYIAAQPEGVREVQFAWQGGEPTLLGVDFFRRAVAAQKRYARAGMQVTNALQTNGTLLDDAWGTFLHDHGFLVGLSVDGPERLHDRYRRGPDGEGSFARVMRGLEVLQRCGVEYNTLTCVQSDNAQYPEEVYRFLTGLGSTFLQFIPIVEPVDGGVSERTVSGEAFGQFMNGVFDAWLPADVGRVFVQLFDVVLGMVMGYPSSLCVHAQTCGRALVVEHNGDVYACDHFVSDDMRRGNITKDALAWMVDGAPQARFGMDKRDSLPDTCRACSWLRLCNGGCPATRIDGENWVCDGYAAFYDHTIPVFESMARALRNKRPASEWLQFSGGTQHDA